MYYIYILELEQNKYYIGKTKNAEIRIENHFDSNGSGWTKKYKPVNVLEIIPNCDSYDEDKHTLKMMYNYSIDDVRGGSFSTIELSNEFKIFIQHMLNSINDVCYVCKKEGHFGKQCKQKLKTVEIKNIEEIIDDEISICTRCRRDGHIKEICNYKTFKGGRRRIKRYKKKKT